MLFRSWGGSARLQWSSMPEESTGVAVVVADLPGGQLLCFAGSRAAMLSGSREVTPARDSLGDGRGSLAGSRQGLTREESARQAVPAADLSAGAAWFQSRAWRVTALRGWAVRRAAAMASGWMVRGSPCSAELPSRDRAEGAASQGVETAVRGAGRGRA